MNYNPEIHHRRSIRLQGYDYSRAGAYFATICTQNRECFFGDVVDGDMVNNIVGRMIETTWLELPNRFPHIDLDEFVVMPNHFHGIIVLSAQRRGESCIRPNPGDHNPGDPNPGDHKDRPYGILPNTLGRIFQTFESICTFHKYLGYITMRGTIRYLHFHSGTL